MHFQQGQFDILVKTNGDLRAKEVRNGLVSENKAFGIHSDIKPGLLSVTHIPTGMRLFKGFKDINGALSFVNAINDLENWLEIGLNDLGKLNKIGTKVKEQYKESGGHP